MPADYAYIKEWRKTHKTNRAEEARRYRAKHPDKVAAVKKRYRESKLEEIRKVDAERQRARRANDPDGQKRRMAEFVARRHAKRVAIAGRDKPDNCEICCGSLGGIVWDHDHSSGAFRGWICDRCNKTLGHVKDDPELLYRLAEYLEAFNVKANILAA